MNFPDHDFFFIIILQESSYMFQKSSHLSWFPNGAVLCYLMQPAAPTLHWFTWAQWHLTPVLLPGKSHGWRNLMGCSPGGCEESDTTERLPSHFSLSCIGEGNGNLLQCSCLENPRDGEAWWAAVSGVTQIWTRLNRLSSSSSNPHPSDCTTQQLFLFSR